MQHRRRQSAEGAEHREEERGLQLGHQRGLHHLLDGASASATCSSTAAAKTPLDGAKYVHFKGVSKELPQVLGSSSRKPGAIVL